jgi:hypothetical protein
MISVLVPNIFQGIGFGFILFLIFWIWNLVLVLIILCNIFLMDFFSHFFMKTYFKLGQFWFVMNHSSWFWFQVIFGSSSNIQNIKMGYVQIIKQLNFYSKEKKMINMFLKT